MITHSKPFIGQQEKNALISCLDSGMLIAGLLTKKLETNVAHESGYNNAIATSSASQGISLALQIMFPQGNARIALPSYVCRSVYDAICMARCCPVIVDIDPITFAISQSLVINQNVDAAIVAHMFGIHANYSEIQKANIPVIEDCAQRISPMPEISKNQRALFRVYSFEATKIITSGEGGILCCSDDKLFYDLKCLITGGYDYRKYSIKVTFTDIQAALAIEQWKQLSQFLEKRRNIAELYTEQLIRNKLDHHIVPAMLESDTYHFRYVLQVDSPEIVIEKMEHENIICRKPVNPYNLHTLFEVDGLYPISDFALMHNLSIPLYPALSNDEAKFVINTLIQVLRQIQ